MGIYDRDYYREKTNILLGNYPFQASVALAALYACLFLLQLTGRDGRFDSPRQDMLTERLELNPHQALDGELWRLVTYTFVHNPRTLVPLLLNIVILLTLGRQLEKRCGWKEFIAFYLLAGFVAGAGFTGISALVHSDRVLLGPAGSISAVLVLLALQQPGRIVLLFHAIPCRIWFVLGFYVVYNAAEDGNVRSEVPAIGFAVFYYRCSLVVSNWLPRTPANSTRSSARPRLQAFRVEPLDDAEPTMTASGSLASSSHAAAHASPIVQTSSDHALLDEHLEAKLDEVLQKVNSHGQESLSDVERAVLFRASEIFRRRRRH